MDIINMFYKGTKAHNFVTANSVTNSYKTSNPVGDIMIVYKTTNLVNDMIYVGVHNTSANDGYIGSGKILKNSIKKHGRYNFQRETLEHVTEDNWREREKFWIPELSASDKSIGYNIHEGGGGFIVVSGTDNHRYGKKHSKESNLKNSLAHVGKKHSSESKLKMSLIRIGEKTHFFGKKHSKKTIRMISKKATGRPMTEEGKRKISKFMSSDKHPRLGVKYTLEAKEKLSKSIKKYYKNESEEHKLGRMFNTKTCKKVKIDGVVYNSIKHAARIFNTSPPFIAYRIKSKNFKNYEFVNVGDK